MKGGRRGLKVLSFVGRSSFLENEINGEHQEYKPDEVVHAESFVLKKNN